MPYISLEEKHLEIIKEPSTTSTVEAFGDKLDDKSVVVGDYKLGKIFRDVTPDTTPTKDFIVQPTYIVKSYS